MKHPRSTRKTNKKSSTEERDRALLQEAHESKGRKLKHTLIGLTGHILLAIIITAWGISNQHHSASAQSLTSFRQTLGLQSLNTTPQTIQSNAGFTVTYNTSLVHAQALVLPNLATNPSSYQNGTGAIDLYNGADLNTTRNYSAVDFWTSGSTKDTALIKVNPVWQMQLVTNLQANIFADGRNKYGASTSNLDLTEKLFAPQQTSTTYNTVVPSLAQQTNVTIGGTNYRKLVYKMTDTTFLKDTYDQVQYLTVQNGRPYAVELDISPTTQAGDVSLLMQVLDNIHYTSPSSDALVGLSSSKGSKSIDATAQVTTASAALPNSSVNLPNQLNSNALEIIAKNQPGVVRVGVIDCFDFNLLLPNKTVAASFHGACGAGSGSGSIVSSNGYISTNGHVAVSSPSDAFELYMDLAANDGNAQPIQEYVNYLAASNVAPVSQINKLITAVQAGDNNAAQTLLNLTGSIPYARYQVTASHSYYAIQLSTEPIKLNQQGTNLSFTYDKNVVPASFVAANYDASQQENGTANLDTYNGTDVALLKMKGNNFPIIKLGSINDVQNGSALTAVGWPGFVDGGLQTTKSKTIPTATQGTVNDIGKEPGGPYNLIVSSLPIAEGNSGGPGLNSQGLEVGLTTYATQSVDPESGVDKLSTGSVLRNINDFKAILTQHNITLDTNSQVSTLWDSEVNDFAIGHYKDAVQLSKQIKSLYPSQYLAASFSTAAQHQIALGHDTSSPNALIRIGEGLAIIWLIAISVIGTMFLRHRRHGIAMGYYPAPAINQGSNWQGQAVTSVYGTAPQAAAPQPVPPTSPSVNQQQNTQEGIPPPQSPQLPANTQLPNPSAPQVVQPQNANTPPVVPVQPTQQVNQSPTPPKKPDTQP